MHEPQLSPSLLSFSRLTVFLVLGTAWAQGARADSIDEFSGYAVDNYSGAECVNGDLNHTIDQLNAFKAVLDSWVAWDVTLTSTDASVDDYDWADEYKEPDFGDDEHSAGVDSADVAYFSGHGSHACNEEVGYGSWFYVSDSSPIDGECDIDYSDELAQAGQDAWWGNSASAGDASGNGDLGLVYFDACRTMQKCVWETGGYAASFGAHLRMIAGFHGLSNDSVGQVNALEDYVSNSRLSGVGDNWLDERWEDPYNDTEQCPTLLIRGSSSTVRTSFYNNGGIDDRFSLGTQTGGTVFSIAGCYPAGGEEL